MDKTIGRYAVLRLIGEGSMGQVYAGYDPLLDRRVALKLLRADVFASARSRDRALREARALAKLSHPNVVQVFEVGEHDGRPFIAMELVDGLDLRRWLASDDRSWRCTLNVVVAAGRGLAAVHAAGLLHLDLKPDNLLVSGHGRALIADFGLLASHAERELDETAEDPPPSCSASGSPENLSEAPLTVHNHVLGTPAYMSPEQHRGETLDARSDQFSLCVTLYEALYGRRPFAGDTRAAVRERILAGELLSPPHSAVPRNIERAILRGLAPDPSDRWSSLSALLDALEFDPSRRRRVVAGFALLGALAAGTGVVYGSLEPEVNDPCTDSSSRLAEVWNDNRRLELRAAFRATGAAHAESTSLHLVRALNAYAESWSSQYANACESLRGDEHDPRVFELSRACFDRRLVQLDTLTEVLTEVTVETVDHAAGAVDSLPRTAPCGDAKSLLAETAPLEDPRAAREVERLRAELARAYALEVNGHNIEGSDLVDALEERVTAVDYPPLTAEHRLRRASLLLSSNSSEAELAFGEAYHVAIRTRYDALAAEASARIMYTTGVELGRYDEALEYFDQALAWSRSVDDDRELRGLVLHNAATIWGLRGQARRAVALARDAVEVWTDVLGEEHAQVDDARLTLATYLPFVDECDEAYTTIDELLTRYIGTFGAEHPDVEILSYSRCLLNTRCGDLDAALRCAPAPARAHIASYGVRGHVNWLLLAILAYRNAGDLERAAALAHDLLTGVPADPDVRNELRAAIHHQYADLLIASGELELAESQLTAGIGYLNSLDTDRGRVDLQLQTGLAKLALARGELDEARDLALDVIAMIEASETDFVGLLIAPRFVLARVAAREGAIEEARALARSALVEGPGLDHTFDHERAEIRAWLVARERAAARRTQEGAGDNLR